MKNTKTIVACLMVAALVGCNETQDLPIGKKELEAKQIAEWNLLRYADPATGEIPSGIRARELAFLNEALAPKQNDHILAAQSWEYQGPHSLGGRTRTVAVDLANSNHLVAGAVSGGIWNSYDFGESWQKATSALDLHSVTWVTQHPDPNKHHVWYASTGEYRGNSASLPGDGVFVSTDNGTSWSLLPSTVTNVPGSNDNPFDYATKIIVRPTLDDDMLFVATVRNGIMRSDDGGDTWVRALGTSNTNNQYADVLMTPVGDLYAVISSGSGQGIFHSEDGSEWENITPEELSSLNARRILLDFEPSTEQLYVFGESTTHGKPNTGDLPCMLWVRDSQGAWRNRTSFLPDNEQNGSYINTQQSYNVCFAVTPGNPNVIFAGGTNLFRSTDGFTSQSNTTWIGGYRDPDGPREPGYPWYPQSHPDMHVVTFVPGAPGVLLNAHDGGLSATLDYTASDVEWSFRNSGFNTSQFYSVGVEKHRSSDVVFGGTQDNRSRFTMNSGPNAEWTLWNVLGDGAFVDINNTGSLIYGGKQLGQTYRFALNDGSVPTNRSEITPPSVAGSLFITPFMLDPDVDNVMYHASSTQGNGLQMNSDISAQQPDGNWRDLITGATGSVSAIAVSRGTNAKVLYAGTSAGRLFVVDDPLGGDPQSRSMFHESGYISSILIDKDNKDHIFLTYSNYGIRSVYESFDGGETVHSISGNLEENWDGTGAGPGVNWIQMLEVDGKKTYYVATTGGVFSTQLIDGNNTSWRREGALSVGNVPADMIVTRELDDRVYVATHGAGIWKADVTDYEELPLGTPMPLIPANNSSWVSGQYQFEWAESFGAGTYEIQVSDSEDFTSNVSAYQGLLGSSQVLDLDLQSGEQYYWRIKATNSTHQSDWSQVHAFSSSPSIALQSPTNGIDPTVTRPVQLQWQGAESVDSYSVYVSKFPGMFNLVVEETGLTTTTFTPELEPNTQYFWKVEAFGPNNVSVETDVWSFKTALENSVDISSVANAKVIPNPAQGLVRIEHDNLNVGSEYNVRIVNAHGSVVMSLVSRVTLNGVLPLTVEQLSSGSYQVLVSDQKNRSVATASLVVVK